MKIRLKADSIRLRLGPTEVASLIASGVVTESTRLAPNVHLTFILRASDTAAEISVAPDGLVVRIDVPMAMVEKWGAGDEVGISADPVENSRPAVLIEKDFACRHDGPGADVYHDRIADRD
jgi:hypothetical protein